MHASSRCGQASTSQSHSRGVISITRRKCDARPASHFPATNALPRQRVLLYDLHDCQVPYEEAWAWQKRLVHAVHHTSGAAAGGGAGLAGVVLLLQHPPVYTLGAGATDAHLRFDPASPPLPLHRTERGGEVTYHGPGQLVLYPLLDLKRFQTDLHWYLRSLEEVVIRALEEVSGLRGDRIDGLTGVWVGGSKVAAIGVRATRWVTYHGLALNVTTDLAPFGGIVPCGIADRGVTSVAGLLREAAAAARGVGGPGEIDGVSAATESSGGGAVGLEAVDGEAELRLLEEYRHGLVAALEEVFGVEVEACEGGEAWEQLRRLAPGVGAADGHGWPAASAA